MVEEEENSLIIIILDNKIIIKTMVGEITIATIATDGEIIITIMVGVTITTIITMDGEMIMDGEITITIIMDGEIKAVIKEEIKVEVYGKLLSMECNGLHKWPKGMKAKFNLSNLGILRTLSKIKLFYFNHLHIKRN